MEFQGFSMQTSEYLWELSFHNERPWFLAHREEFETLLNRPFKALAADTLDLMRQRRPERDYQGHVSRISRDARRLFGRGPYKDHLWFTIYTGDRHDGGPAFWFEVDAATYSYGLGFWDATAAQMEVYRRRIDATPAAFERLIRPIDRGGYRMFGAAYKRPKAERPEPIGRWYNRRSVSAGREYDFGGELLSEKLPFLLADCYEELTPLHDFLWEVWHAEREPEEKM